jgi:tripartite-type tricarboxylate transporter receptor subunit TctC
MTTDQKVLKTAIGNYGKQLTALPIILVIILFAVIACPRYELAYAAESGSSYPSKPVRMILPFDPGGGTDLTARLVAKKLSETLGQPVIVENRGGAGGVIATEAVAKAAPDGYTLLWGTSSGMVINPLLNNKLPYNPTRDFAPVSMVAVNPFLLVVNKELPVNSFKELVALAKAKPGELNYSTPGAGSPAHLAMEVLKEVTGTDIVAIHYKGAGPALVDIVAGRVQMKFNSIQAVVPMIKGGQIKALAITTAQRSKVMPEIPTISESGVPGFEVVTWYGVFMPAKTPRDIVDKLNAQIVKAMSSAEVGQRLIDEGAEPRSSTPAGLVTYMREESERWKKALKNMPPPTN